MVAVQDYLGIDKIVFGDCHLSQRFPNVELVRVSHVDEVAILGSSSERRDGN